MALDIPQLELVEAFHVVVPFRRPFATANGVIAARSSWILRLRDMRGRDGFGEIALDPSATPLQEGRLTAAVREAVAELSASRIPEPRGVFSSGAEDRAVLAGIAGAMTGLGRGSGRKGVSPRRLTSVAVNATLDASSPQETAAAALRAVSAGFYCLKLKVGSEDTAALVARVAAVRRAVPPSVQLRLDANGTWTHAMAVDRLTALGAYNIEYVEQPLAPGDLTGHAALRLETRVPIALDEAIVDEQAAVAALAAGAADVLVVKPARVGGVGVLRAIAGQAAAAGVPVVVSSYFETGVGIYAALRAAADLPIVGDERAHGLATAGLLESDLMQVSATVSAGRIGLPPKLAVDEAALARYTIDRIGPGR